MKKLILSFAAISLTVAASYAGVTLRYYNKDSNDQTFKVKTCGNNTEVKFTHSTTSSVTIQGCSDAVIYTSKGEVKVKDGDKVIVTDGEVKVVDSL